MPLWSLLVSLISMDSRQDMLLPSGPQLLISELTTQRHQCHHNINTHAFLCCEVHHLIRVYFSLFMDIGKIMTFMTRPILDFNWDRALSCYDEGWWGWSLLNFFGKFQTGNIDEVLLILKQGQYNWLIWQRNFQRDWYWCVATLLERKDQVLSLLLKSLYMSNTKYSWAHWDVLASI